METGSKNALLKKRIITHYIYNGSSTITDLAKELDLSVPTTTKFINEMCEDNYINDYGKLETSSGRHPSLYGLNPESGYFIGVDIKKFAINIGLINFKGDMVEIKMNIPYKFENTQEALEELCALIRNFIKGTEINDKKIMNICINISGRVNPESGYSFSMFNFSERPLADVLNEKIGYPVCIDNDTRAMTYGEHMQGCVKGEKDIIFVNISWGLGIGIIIDGKVYTGKSGFPENSGMSMFSIMKYCATAAKKDAWKRKPQDRHYTASCWKESVAEKVPYYQNGLQKIRPPWMKSSPQSIKRTCYALR